MLGSLPGSCLPDCRAALTGLEVLLGLLGTALRALLCDVQNARVKHMERVCSSGCTQDAARCLEVACSSVSCPTQKCNICKLCQLAWLKPAATLAAALAQGLALPQGTVADSQQREGSHRRTWL